VHSLVDIVAALKQFERNDSAVVRLGTMPSCLDSFIVIGSWSLTESVHFPPFLFRNVPLKRWDANAEVLLDERVNWIVRLLMDVIIFRATVHMQEFVKTVFGPVVETR
jgi:hypothetical protein